MFTKINEYLSSPKMRAAFVLILVLLPFALGVGNVVNQEFYVAVTELLFHSDVPDGIRVGVSVLGLIHSGVEVAIWTTVFGGPAGFVAGLVVGG